MVRRYRVPLQLRISTRAPRNVMNVTRDAIDSNTWNENTTCVDIRINN